MTEYLDQGHGKRPDGITERVVFSNTKRVSCIGAHMEHPNVYYTIPDEGEVVCGYCDTIFRFRQEEDEI